MANELRVRQNFIGGLVEDNPLTASATTLTSAGLASIPAIDTTQHFPITFDPDGLYGAPEVAYVTAHTTAATTATILRGQESTVARQHKQDMNWTHGPTLRDFTPNRILIKRAGFTNNASGTNLSLTNTAATPVTLDTAMDISIKADVGDLLCFTSSHRVSGAGTAIAYFDAATVNPSGGAIINYFSNGVGADMYPPWIALASLDSPRYGAAFYQVVAGDIFSGLVKVSFVYRIGAGTARTLLRDSSQQVAVLQNLGPLEG